MPTFSYVGLTPQGQELRGQLEAGDLNQARSTLRGQGLRILEVVAGSGDNSRSLLHLLRRLWRLSRNGLSVRNTDMMLFYRQMQLMLRAGHTILQALEAAGRLV